MKKNKFTELQIVKVAKEAGNGRSIEDISSKLRIKPQTLNN